MPHSKVIVRLAFVVSAVCIVPITASAQITYEVIGELDAFGPRRPYGGVIKASNGALYGTAYDGGTTPPMWRRLQDRDRWHVERDPHIQHD